MIQGTTSTGAGSAGRKVSPSTESMKEHQVYLTKELTILHDQVEERIDLMKGELEYLLELKSQISSMLQLMPPSAVPSLEPQEVASGLTQPAPPHPLADI